MPRNGSPARLIVALFLETFNTVREHFVVIFRKLFNGGKAEITLEDETKPLECGTPACGAAHVCLLSPSFCQASGSLGLLYMTHAEFAPTGEALVGIRRAVKGSKKRGNIPPPCENMKACQCDAE